MRKLKIFEHISLDGVIEVRGSATTATTPTATGQPPIAVLLAEM
jgi:hypothetical protein